MHKLIFLCFLLFAVKECTQQAHQTNHPFKGDNWEKTKNLLEEKSEKKIGVFVVLFNSPLVKQYKQYVQLVVHSFDQAGQLFSVAVSQHNLMPPNEEWYFGSLDSSNKNAMNYIHSKLGSFEKENLQKWLLNHPIFVLKLTNEGTVQLMQNTDMLNHHLILSWVEKQTRIPLLKHIKQMTSFSDITISALNVVLIMTCLGFLTIGDRNGNFRIRQLATLPICLFSAGHIFNQINGNDGGEPTWMGVSFSRHYNGQTLGESYLIFAIYVAINIGFFGLIESLKKDAPSKSRVVDVSRLVGGLGRGRARVGAKMCPREKGSSGTSQVAYFTLTLTASFLLYRSYLLKY